jgi:hypothetical protein
MAASPTTWTALLAHFTGIAQRAVGLPRTPEGDRFRSAVPHVIALQAVTLALDHAESLPEEAFFVGLDRAEVVMRDHAAALRGIYQDALPDAIAATLEDAGRALASARASGLGWVVTAEALAVEHPAGLVEALLGNGFDGDLLLPTPGVPLFRSAPCAFVRSVDATPLPDGMLALIGLYLGQKDRLARGPIRVRPMQVYRQFDFAQGGPARDFVAALDAPDVPGQPLLLWAIRGGQAQGVPLPPRNQPPVRALPVVFDDAP